MRLYTGLVHYPVYNKHYQRIASAITTTDLHDLARLARTYGIRRFFVINPLRDQQKLAERILSHWTVGYGATYNPNRKEAFELLAVASTLEASIEEIEKIEGEKPLLVATDARKQNARSITYAGTRDILADDRVVLLVFGTAWGLDKETIDHADYLLDPIMGPTDYNHLSVRTAAAIILDRLAGRRPEQ